MVKVRSALKAVASTATQLQQLRLLTGTTPFADLLGTDDLPPCFDIGTLVGQGPHPPILCACCSPPLQVKRAWPLCCGDT